MVNPDNDFIRPSENVRDIKLASLVDAIMSADIQTKDRKSILTGEQALQIARVRAYADSFAEYAENGDEIAPPLMELHALCDYLQNTAVSVQGKGLKQLVEILSAVQRSENEQAELSRTAERVMR